jgi:UDP-N-acetylglucosamine 2-epimerase
MKISIILGTRPEIIKFAPVVKELEKRNIDLFVFYTASALLTAHVATLFNLSRYIRLTYTALALTLPTIATTLTAASTVALLITTK